MIWMNFLAHLLQIEAFLRVAHRPWNRKTPSLESRSIESLRIVQKKQRESATCADGWAQNHLPFMYSMCLCVSVCIYIMNEFVCGSESQHYTHSLTRCVRAKLVSLFGHSVNAVVVPLYVEEGAERERSSQEEERAKAVLALHTRRPVRPTAQSAHWAGYWAGWARLLGYFDPNTPTLGRDCGSKHYTKRVGRLHKESRSESEACFCFTSSGRNSSMGDSASSGVWGVQPKLGLKEGETRDSNGIYGPNPRDWADLATAMGAWHSEPEFLFTQSGPRSTLERDTPRKLKRVHGWVERCKMATPLTHSLPRRSFSTSCLVLLRLSELFKEDLSHAPALRRLPGQRWPSLARFSRQGPSLVRPMWVLRVKMGWVRAWR